MHYAPLARRILKVGLIYMNNLKMLMPNSCENQQMFRKKVLNEQHIQLNFFAVLTCSMSILHFLI